MVFFHLIFHKWSFICLLLNWNRKYSCALVQFENFKIIVIVIICVYIFYEWFIKVWLLTYLMRRSIWGGFRSVFPLSFHFYSKNLRYLCVDRKWVWLNQSFKCSSHCHLSPYLWAWDTAVHHARHMCFSI